MAGLPADRSQAKLQHTAKLVSRELAGGRSMKKRFVRIRAAADAVRDRQQKVQKTYRKYNRRIRAARKLMRVVTEVLRRL
jgi:hypothetical protein